MTLAIILASPATTSERAVMRSAVPNVSSIVGVPSQVILDLAVSAPASPPARPSTTVSPSSRRPAGRELGRQLTTHVRARGHDQRRPEPCQPTAGGYRDVDRDPRRLTPARAVREGRADLDHLLQVNADHPAPSPSALGDVGLLDEH